MELNLGCGGDSGGDVRLDAFREGTSANIVADCQHLPFRDECFDSVREVNVFEHLPNPGRHLQEVRRVLKAGGTLSLTTDNAACLKFYVLGTHMGGYRKRGGKDLHYALFTQEHIRNMMAYAGLRVEQVVMADTRHMTLWFDRLVRLLMPDLSYPLLKVSARRPP